MKPGIIFTSILLLSFLTNSAYADITSTTSDMFGLEMQVIAPFPDLLDDGVDMDTVRYGYKVSVKIKYKNLTPSTQHDFEINAFFPNRFESYSRLIGWNLRPDYVDTPDSSMEARWKFPTLAPNDSGTIELTLVINRAPKDTIYLSYEASARARWTPVSQVSHTNIYIPGEGLAPYPDLRIYKVAYGDSLFPGDSLKFTLRYVNISEPGSTPAEFVTVYDTLPAGFNIIENQFTPTIDTLADGRLLLTWQIPHIVPNFYADSVSFWVTTDVITDRDTTLYNSCLVTSQTGEIRLGNNRDRVAVRITPKIDLAVVQQGPPSYNLFKDDSQSFTLRCSNNSSIDLTGLKLVVTIDDGIPGSNIYQLQNIVAGQTDPTGTTITWDIDKLSSQQSTQRNFSVIINNVSQAQDYTINFVAMIDTVVLLSDGLHRDIDQSDNRDAWQIQIDGTPNLSVDLSETANRTVATPNQTLNFRLVCGNSSSATLDSVNLRCWFEGDSVFSISNTDGRVTGFSTDH